MKRYQAKAPELKTDPIGYAFVPFGYAARPDPGAGGHCDQEPRSRHSSPNTSTATRFKTVVGEISFGKDGEWTKPRTVLTQFQNVEPNNVDQFQRGDKAADPVAARIQDRRR